MVLLIVILKGVATVLPQLKSAFCAEKKRLIEAFTAAVSEYLRVQSVQLTLLIENQSFAFEAELNAARERKDAARLAIAAHEQQHGC